MISICEDLLKHPSNLHEMLVIFICSSGNYYANYVRLITKILLSLPSRYGLNLTEAVLKEEIEKILPHVESFVSKYVLQKNCQMGQKGFVVSFNVS